MKSDKPKSHRSVRFNLPIYIMLVGWLSVIIFALLSFEPLGSGNFIDHFLSPDRSGIRFRALILFAPLVSTIAGYMVHERERLMRDLELSNKELADLLLEKDDFITRLGHDLKTPLTPLINLLPLVRKRTKDKDIHGLLDVTIQNASTLKELIVKTLKLARSSRTYAPDEVSDHRLEEIVESCIKKHSYAIEEKNIEIINELQPELMVKCNDSDIEELLGNLLTNAIKFSYNGGPVILSAAKEKHMTTISVRDFGLGLTEEQVEKVFDSFYKADKARHELDSSGLGLSICKKIVENHNGKIWAQSPGQWLGATICFTLPTGNKPRQWRL